MRILIATPFQDPDQGVLGLYAQGLTGAFIKEGHTVSLVSWGRLERVLPPVLRHFSFFLKVFLHGLRSDAILALDTWSAGVPSLFASLILGKRYGVRIGGDLLWESYVERTQKPILLSEFYTQPRNFSLKERAVFSILQFLVRHADALFFTTRFQEHIWQKPYGFAPSKSCIVENYYPTSGSSGNPTERVFVSAGRNLFIKNREMLKRAFARVASRHPDISLDVRPLAHDAHLARLSVAYAVIIPTFSEVCSNTAIEAASLGKPFIMSRDTGTSERLSACGLFIDTRNEGELESAIEKLLDTTTYDRASGESRAFSYTHSWGNIAKEISETFSKI